MAPMIRTLVIILTFSVSACASIGGDSIISACQTYYTVKAVIDLAAWMHPAIGSAAAAIHQVVDPVCRVVMAGQPAPQGIDAAWVRSRTVELEELAVRER